MTLSFSQQLNGKPTYFPEKIMAGLSDKIYPMKWPYSDLYEVVEPTDEEFEAGCCNPGFPHVPKLHTIREDKADRWRAGMDIHMVINNRRPNRYQFVPVVKCVSVQKIEIRRCGNSLFVAVDGGILSVTGYRDLARNDGFASEEEFFAYFNRDFTGKIIHWTHLRY